MKRGDNASVVVVGAGPAGSSAAFELARAGVPVTMIERARFPRDKVCGECLSDLGVRSLRRSGLDAALRLLRPVLLTASRFVAPGGAELRMNLPSPMWGLARRAMDMALLEAAREAGARILQPSRVEHLAPGPCPRVIVRHLPDNRVEQLNAHLVLIADGKGTLIAPSPATTGDLGLQAHFEAVDADEREIALFGLRGHYAGLAPAADGSGGLIWNLASSVPQQRVRDFAGDHDALLSAMRRENARLDAALASARRVGPWHACPLPRFGVRRSWPKGVIPIGNAAAALEPIGGEGMGLAIASALLAARWITAGGLAGGDVEELRRRYVRLWRGRRAACRAAAVLLSGGRTGSLAIRAARLAPVLGRLGMALAGKRVAPGEGMLSRV